MNVVQVLKLALLDILSKEATANKSTNITADAASDTKYPSVKAVKTYADGLVVGLLDDRGNYDPTATSAYPATGGSGAEGAILKGDLWYISTDGVLGTKPVKKGYSIRALADAPGQTDDNWDILDVGVGYIPEDASKKDATGGYVGLTGFAINIKNAAGTVLSAIVSAATAARTWTFPDKDGTVAMISDIPNAKVQKVAKYIVTTAFVANEEITLTTGAGATAGVTTASGDCAGVKGILGASANAFRDDNTIEVLENGVEMWKSVDVVWVSQDADNGDKIKFPVALDIGDTFVVKYFV